MNATDSASGDTNGLVRLSFQTTGSQEADLKALAKRNDRSLSAEVRIAVDAHIAANSKVEAA